MSRTLLSGGVVVTMVDDEPADWLLVEEGVVVGSGRSSDLPRADSRVDLDGAVVVPGFCDSHVHLGATGLAELAVDLGDCGSARAVADAFRPRAAGGGVLYGTNLSAALGEVLTRFDLDEAVGDRPALAAQSDLHSCVVSSALLNSLPETDLSSDGRAYGRLRETDAASAWRWLDAGLTPEQHRAAVEAAATAAIRRGVTEVHEMFVLEWRDWRSYDLLADHIPQLPLRVYPYIATTDVKAVVGRGIPCIGGDLFLDGAFGSRTAWLSEPYSDRPDEPDESGMSYRSDDEVRGFFLEAQRNGLQTGVHAIGDAAVSQAISAWEWVASVVGIEAVRRLHHRIEHFECASDDHIRRAVALGLTASVQPAFDRLWGGPDGLYARRISWKRAAAMNRFSSMRAAGLRLGAGSDSTVTPLDPFLQMASLREHHVRDERLDARSALHVHTAGSHSLGGDGRGGSLAPGEPADLVVLDRNPLQVDAAGLIETEVLSTWAAGRPVWPRP